MNTIEEILSAWSETALQQPFKPLRAYHSALDQLKKINLLPEDLDALLKHIPTQWDNHAPMFEKYGLFVSATAVVLNQTNPVVVVRTSTIENYFVKQKGDAWYKKFGGRTLLDYLGYHHNKGIVIYDGDAGNVFGKDVSATLYLTGNAGNLAGLKQQRGKIVISGGVQHAANKKQQGGVTLICRNAGNRIDYKKKRGITYVLGSVGDYAAKEMGGGRLFVVKNVGHHCGAGIRGTAEVYFGGIAGNGLGRDKCGGKIINGPLIINSANTLFYNTVVFLKKHDIEPSYHR